MKKTICIAALVFVVATEAKAALVLLSIPEDSMDSASRPLNEDVWSVAPVNVNSGIGYLVNPTLPAFGDFVMHDHVYVAPNVPDPARAIVTYGFNVSTQVNSIEIVEHFNGISIIEGFAGDSLGSMTSVGVVTGTAGPGPYAEFSSNTFSFGLPLSALYFQFIVRETFSDAGYAAYRAYPAVTEAVPEASTVVAWSVILLTAGLSANRLRSGFAGLN